MFEAVFAFLWEQTEEVENEITLKDTWMLWLYKKWWVSLEVLKRHFLEKPARTGRRRMVLMCRGFAILKVCAIWNDFTPTVGPAGAK